MKPRMSSTFSTVSVMWNRSSVFAPASRSTVKASSTPSAAYVSFTCGQMPCVYAPNAMAITAAVAGNPAVTETHPARNPASG